MLLRLFGQSRKVDSQKFAEAQPATPSGAPASAALALLTTLAQLGAELEGRSYGDGVLKIEPSAANCLPLPIDSGTNKTEDLARADHLLRVGKAEDAVCLADQAMLSSIASEEDVTLLREAVFELRNRRIRRGSSKPEL